MIYRILNGLGIRTSDYACRECDGSGIGKRRDRVVKPGQVEVKVDVYFCRSCGYEGPTLEFVAVKEK